MAKVAARGLELEPIDRLEEKVKLLVAMVDRTTVDIRIWERGAGYTLASGSSSCAAAAAAVRTGRCDAGAIRVIMPGGVLVVDVRADWTLRLEGPVTEVFTGLVAPGLVTGEV